MKVGIVLPTWEEDGAAGRWADLAGLAIQAESGGIDSLWVFDHLFTRDGDGDEGGMHEAFTTLAALAVVTTRVSLGPLVACTSFRSPGMLAKIAATLARLAPGRIILGLGCGWHEPEYTAFGMPFDHRVGRFEETLSVVRPLLDGERVTFAGRWTETRDAVLWPAPDPAHRVPIVIAADSPRMLSLVSRFGDGWHAAWFGAPDAGYREEHERMLDASARDGRATPPDVHVGVRVLADRTGSDSSVALDAASVTDALGAWEAEGVAHVQLWVDPATPATFDIVLDGLRRWKD